MAGNGWIIVGLSIFMAGIAAALLVPMLADAVTGMRRTVQIRALLVGDSHGMLTGVDKGMGTTASQGEFAKLFLAHLCTNGVLPSRFVAPYLYKIKTFKQLVDNTQAVLSIRIAGCNSKAVAETLVALSVLCALLIYLLTSQIVLGLAGLTLPLFLVHFKVQKTQRARRNLLREQLPDALRGLGMCFMAGLSLEQAFDQTAQECREPLRRELQRTVHDLHTGSTIRESLDSLDIRLAMDEMRFVSVALEIQHRTGGSMREVLDSAADSLLASFDLSRSLEVQTAQARMSARIVSIMPVALVVVLSIAMEGYLASFFSSPAGLALLLCAIGMQVAGILVIRKILGIDLK